MPFLLKSGVSSSSFCRFLVNFFLMPVVKFQIPESLVQAGHDGHVAHAAGGGGARATVVGRRGGDVAHAQVQNSVGRRRAEI